MGAGEASYFEWAEVHVLFQRQPDEQAMAAITEAVPPPLRDSILWNGIHLMVASDQLAHVAIEEAYGSPDEEAFDEEEELEGDESEDDDGDWFFASDAAVARFNAAIEEWLHQAHRACPILVAYRHEDGESGGTELSPWHRWSAHQTDRLLPVLEPILERGVDDATAHAASGVLQMLRDSGVFLPKRVLALLDPGASIRAALDAGDSEALVDQIETKDEALELLEEELSVRQAKHLRALLGASETLIELEGLPEQVTLALVQAALTLPDANRELPDETERALDHARARAQSSKPIADMIAYRGYQAIETGRWSEAIGSFELVIDSPNLDRTAYNNALFAIMADNNGLPVDRARAERFLGSALRFAADNPSIFYNAACVYMELEDLEATLDCLRRAREHGYEHAEKMRDEPIFAPIASDPRFLEIFKDLD